MLLCYEEKKDSAEAALTQKVIPAPPASAKEKEKEKEKEEDSGCELM